METKGGKRKSNSSSSDNSIQYEAPLGYSIEDVRPNGGIEKFRSAAYSNVKIETFSILFLSFIFLCVNVSCCLFAVREEAILIFSYPNDAISRRVGFSHSLCSCLLLLFSLLISNLEKL